MNSAPVSEIVVGLSNFKTGPTKVISSKAESSEFLRILLAKIALLKSIKPEYGTPIDLYPNLPESWIDVYKPDFTTLIIKLYKLVF